MHAVEGGPREAKGQRGADGSTLARGTAPPRLRHSAPDRPSLRRLHPFSRLIAISIALSARKARLDPGPLARKGKSTPAPLLPAHPPGSACFGGQAPPVAGICGRRRPHRRSGTCLNGNQKSKNASLDCILSLNENRKYSTNCPATSRTATTTFAHLELIKT